jgi:hypothetical protein
VALKVAVTRVIIPSKGITIFPPSLFAGIVLGISYPAKELAFIPVPNILYDAL